MKKRLVILTLSSLFILFNTSCANVNLSSINTSITQNIEKKLSASAQRLEFDQYEELSYSNFIVKGLTYVSSELTDTKDINSFKIYDEQNKLIEDKQKLTFYGDEKKLKIVSDDESYLPTYISIKVLKAKGYTQKLIVTNPDKVDYFKGDTVDLSGLNVQLETSYYVNLSDNRYKIDTLSPSDYSLLINGQKYEDGYVLDGYGIYTMTISIDSFTSSGVAKNVTHDFYLYSIHKSIPSDPIDYSSTNIDTDFEQDNREVTINISNPNKNNTDKGYLSPDEVEVNQNVFTYGKNNAENWQYSPSTNNVPFLIIPVVIPDEDSTYIHVNNSSLATPSLFNKINDAFFASSTKVPFESLRSYYAKSSHNKINITGTITDFYVPSKDPNSTFKTYSSFVNENMDRNLFINQALSYVEKTYSLDLAKFDSDKNGIIDGVWFIAVNETKDTSVMSFWGFSSSTQEVGTPENPKINNYGWLCSDFLTNSSGEDKQLDPHVIIHESGHMFGLTDYYSYNQTGNDRYSPLGRKDMMDNNVLDQNPFSKLMIGWQKPYVVYGNAQITIKTDQNLDQCILIPYDSKDYSSSKYKNKDGKVEINLFDEYLLLDFYTDKNLNSRGYEFYNVENISGFGIRAYHVDNRLYKATTNKGDGNYICEEVSADDAYKLLSEKGSNLIRAISNTEAGVRSEQTRFGLPSPSNKFDEIRLISADNTYLSYANPASTSSLFASNGDLENNSEFSLDKYKSQFVEGQFDSKEAFNYSFKVSNYKL